MNNFTRKVFNSTLIDTIRENYKFELQIFKCFLTKFPTILDKKMADLFLKYKLELELN